MTRKIKWTVEFSIDPVWIEDGFEMTDEVAYEIISNWLSYARGYELDAKVIKSPNPKTIRKIQGYND